VEEAEEMTEMIGMADVEWTYRRHMLTEKSALIIYLIDALDEALARLEQMDIE